MTEEAVMYLVGFLFFHIIEGERGNRFTKWNFLIYFGKRDGKRYLDKVNKEDLLIMKDYIVL